MEVKLIYYLSLLFCLETIIGLSGNTCYNGDAQVCCPNFQNENGICKECQNGTTSRKDSNCSRCIPGWYGYKCSTPCNCSNPNDRCDHVKGCVQRTSTAETTLNAVTFSTVVNVPSQPDSVTIKDKTPLLLVRGYLYWPEAKAKDNTDGQGPITRPIQKPLRITTSTGLLFTSQPGSATENTSTKSSTEIIIYCASVGSLLLVMFLGFTYQRYRLKQQSKTLLQLTKVHSMNLLTDEISTGNEEEHYQYIDESRMVDSKKDPENSGDYLEVVDSSSDTSIQQNIDGGYLHPYNALTEPTEAEIHVYLQKDDNLKSISSGSNASLPYTDQQGYFHMYHQLGERCKSLPRDYERSTAHGHIVRDSNYNHSKNCLSQKEEKNISLRHSLDKEEQHQCNFERTEPKFIQEANEMSPKNQGLLKHAKKTPNSNQNKKNLTL